MAGKRAASSLAFLNFVQQVGTVTRFESPARNKHKRWQQLGSSVDRDVKKLTKSQLMTQQLGLIDK